MSERFSCHLCGDILTLQWGDIISKAVLDHIFRMPSKHLRILEDCLIPLTLSWVGKMKDPQEEEESSE